MTDIRQIFECTGCGVVTREPEKQMELYRAAGKISCCPERKMAALSRPIDPKAEVEIKRLKRQCAELQEEADELVVRQYEVSAKAAEISRLRDALSALVSHAERRSLDKGLITGRLITAARDALANRAPDYAPRSIAAPVADIEPVSVPDGDTLLYALSQIAASRWHEDADIDDICTIADRALAATPHPTKTEKAGVGDGLTDDERHIGVIISEEVEGRDNRISVKQWSDKPDRITFGVYMGNHRWMETDFLPVDHQDSAGGWRMKVSELREAPNGRRRISRSGTLGRPTTSLAGHLSPSNWRTYGRSFG